MGSPTPFGSNIYSQLSGAGGMGLPQRVLANSNFPFPNTMSNNMGLNSNFHLTLQQNQSSRPQPISPSRGMLGLSSASLNSQQNLNQMKQRSNQLTNNLLSSNNTMSNFSRQFNDIAHQAGPSLDYIQFPSLGGSRNTTQSQVLPTRNYVNMVNKQEPTSEFQIQQEDFPALPGAQNPTTSNFTDSSIKTTTTGGNYDVAVKDSNNKSFADKTVGQTQRRGIQSHPDGTMTNVPSSMIGDQFGVVGLLAFIRAADTDPNLVALTPGIDLTTLGLNLNQSEPLYPSFQSPWSETPCRPQDIDYHVPTEYLANVYVRDKLAPIRLNRYMDDLLFFLFYVYGGDLLQVAVAAELYNRDWRYHKDERAWMTRAPGMEPVQKTPLYERGTYFFFDVNSWRKVPKEFHLEYSKLEEKPQLPESLLPVVSKPN